jgi:hypothetical protein
LAKAGYWPVNRPPKVRINGRPFRFRIFARRERRGLFPLVRTARRGVARKRTRPSRRFKSEDLRGREFLLGRTPVNGAKVACAFRAKFQSTQPLKQAAHGILRPRAIQGNIDFSRDCGVVVPLFRRLKFSPVLGFLGAGVLLGPYGLGALARQIGWLAPFSTTSSKSRRSRNSASFFCCS